MDGKHSVPTHFSLFIFHFSFAPAGGLLFSFPNHDISSAFYFPAGPLDNPALSLWRLMARSAAKIRSVAFVSLGCPKNLVDSERMLGLLAQDGLTVTADHSAADAI